MGPRAEDQRARLGRWLLAANILWSALALGALHTPVLALSAVLAAASCALIWFDAEPLRSRPAATTIVTIAIILVLWTALQALPIPRSVLGALAAENADVWDRALTPLHEPGPSFVTISLDPVATRVQLLRGITYLLMFLGAIRVAHRPEGVAFLERALVGAGIAMAAAALLHPVFGAQRVFGAYAPGEAYAYAPRHIAPLLNSNHLAGYVNIGLLVAVTSALRRRDTLPRTLAIVASVVLVGANLWAGSRGGTAAMVVGFILTVVFSLATRRSGRANLFASLAFVLVVAGAVVTGILAASDEVREGLVKTDLSKLELIRNAMELVKTHAIFGIGRGAFESVFPSVRAGSEYLVFTHPEDILAQWTIEWGVPMSLLALLSLAWALRPQTMLARSQPPFGAWAALAAAAVHNLVDFNSEVPGVVIALAVCAAIVCGGSGGGSKTSRVERWSSHPNKVAIAGGLVVTIGLGLTLPWTMRELYNEQRTFRDLGVDRSLDKETFHGLAREAMLRHPAEPYFPFIGALRASAARDESVVPWAARAIERSPIFGRVHLLIARMFYVGNPSQARLEYRLAVEQDSGMATFVDKETPRLIGDFDDAMEVVPVGMSALTVLDNLSIALAPRLPATAAQLDAEMLRRAPQSLEPLRRAAKAALSDVTDKEVWCGTRPNTCLESGLAIAERIRDATSGDCEGHVLVAELKVAAGDVQGGLDTLEIATDTTSNRGVCARAIVSLAYEAKQNARTEAALDRLTKLSCLTTEECVENLTFAAYIEGQRGYGRRALALTKRAAERAPERDDLLVSLAEMAVSQNLHGEALDAYSKLELRHPDDPQWAAAVTREKDALHAGLLPH